MKAKIPRGWHSLPKSEKQAIADYLKEIWDKQAEKDMRIILDLYIKMVCLTLHDAFGFGEKRLTMFLGNHKRLFHRQSKMVKDGSQIEYLDRRMAEIFKKDGFPQGFFDKTLGPVEKGERNEQREAD